MIDIKKAKNEFIKYVSNYDMNEKRIKSKYEHSFRVMKNSEKIAESLNLDKEDIDLAILIGLLHDIARFEQWKIYKVYSDQFSFDHGDKGAEILEENNFIRNFISEDKYDDIIKLAIRNHNKFKIDENIKDEKVLLHCKIIRDADKLDIFYEAQTMFWESEEERIKIGISIISDSYFEQFINKKQILIEKNQSELDHVIAIISFSYDLNFKYSKKVVFKTKYIKDILNKFIFKKQETIKRIEIIKKTIDEFLNIN